MVVEGKADQMEIDTLKQAMLRMDAAVTKNRGVQAARQSEAIGALQVALKEVSSTMDGNIRKLQQVRSLGFSFDRSPVLSLI